MKIEDAIESLREAQREGVKSIIIVTWEADVFGREDDEEWERNCEFVANKVDWSCPTEDIIQILEGE
jgi:hypothetical protein